MATIQEVYQELLDRMQADASSGIGTMRQGQHQWSRQNMNNLARAAQVLKTIDGTLDTSGTSTTTTSTTDTDDAFAEFIC